MSNQFHMPTSKSSRTKYQIYSLCAFYYSVLIYFACLGLLKPRSKVLNINKMDQFCGSPFWQYNLTWNITTQPDFTPCFQETILTWIPCLVLWILAPIEILGIYSSELRYTPITLLNLFKAFLATVLCLLSVTELIEALVRTEVDIAPVEYVTPIIKSLTYVLVFALTNLYRNKGVHTSGLMFMFWSLMTITTVINFRSIIRSTLHDHNVETLADWQKLSELRFTVRIVAAPIVIIQLVLACIADKKAQDPFILTGEEYRNRSPENEASILSMLTYWWLNTVMWIGYKRPLTQDDLYAIKPEDRTEAVSQKFEELLEPAILKALEERRTNALYAEGKTSDEQQNVKNQLLEMSEETAEDQNNTQTSKSKWLRLPFRAEHHPLSSGRARARRISEEKKKTAEQIENEGGKYVGVANVIVKSFWPLLLTASLMKLVSSLLTFASPILLDRIIGFVSSNEPSWRGTLYALTLFFLSIAESIFTNREQYLTNLNVMRIRTCLTSALYRKTLRLSSRGKKNYTTGQIVNLMSIDTQRVADLVQNVNSLWSAPLQLILSMTLLYQQLGMAVFAGILVMLLNAPLNAWIAGKLRTLQQMVMRSKDKRIKLLSEIFNGIKIIKIHAWEDSFKKRTEAIRDKEIGDLTRQTWYSAVITFAFTSLPFVVALASFATYVLVDPNNVLDANKVFVSLSLFNIIRVPLAILPMLITNLSTFLVSIKRVNKFLESDEIDPDVIKPIDDNRSVVRIKDGTFKWEYGGSVILKKINLDVPRRKLVAIVGPVGSGKSSLLSAILGDLEKCGGEVLVDRASSMAYVPQEAWILNTTLKSNIMFNKVINEDRYQRVIDACALGPDLKTLELGDQSEIGEKGLNLSGGQKQRVSLARAVYADTDIYLMDDPLNAVDAHVGRHIFDQIIGPKGMLRDRTRILVTNKLSVLPEVDHIIVMSDGKITESGTYEQLLKNRGLFSQILVKYLLENTDGSKVMDASKKLDAITGELKRLEERQTEKAIRESPKREIPETKKTDQPANSHGNGNGNGRNNLTGQEVSQVGSVGLTVHMNFIRTMGINFVIALAIYIISSAFTISTNVWLSEWSNDALNATLSSDPVQRNMRLGVYAGLGLGESICVITSTILLNFACLRGSQLLHNRMLARILRAPMSWFNVTPSGRIINRFSKDIDTVDSTIRFNVRLLMVVTLRSITSLILISVGSVYSMILIVPIVLLYFLFQMFYVATSRQLKRIESTTKSPIYSHFGETVTGTSIIRAFGVSQEFILESNHRLDVNNASYYIGFVAARWLAIRLEFLGFIVVLTAALIAVLSRGIISPGIAGLSVTYSLSVTTVLSFLVRTYSDYETNVVSVERLIEYTRTPVEPDDDEEPIDPSWPARGEITFEDFSARYRPELDLVLNRFNLKISPAERVGLVGRTGAGKSSVTLALFRILEAADGCIIIDDVNISHINLKVLRSKLSIIPQEPIMFTGTIRQNVDPTESYPDDEIWKAIDLAHLGTFLRTLPAGLDHEVSESGGNFSVGQKQLFCLARTLLRRSKILVLDEATAAVDVETDNLIQQTIRKEFKDSTILTIAHRLETIQDYDKVVIMENGSTIEEGAPADLLKKTNSRFHGLAKEAGLTN